MPSISVAGCNVGHRLLYKSCLLLCLFSGWCALSTTTARSRSLEEAEKYQACAASSAFRIGNSILVLTRLRQLKARTIKNRTSAIQVSMICKQTLLTATVLEAPPSTAPLPMVNCCHCQSTGQSSSHAPAPGIRCWGGKVEMKFPQTYSHSLQDEWRDGPVVCEQFPNNPSFSNFIPWDLPLAGPSTASSATQRCINHANKWHDPAHSWYSTLLWPALHHRMVSGQLSTISPL